MTIAEQNQVLIIHDSGDEKFPAERLGENGFSRSCLRTVTGDLSLRPQGAELVIQTPLGDKGLTRLGLHPGEWVLSLPDFIKRLPDLPPAGREARPSPLIAFLLGLACNGRPSSTRDVLEALPVLMETLQYRVAVLYGDLKVAGAGLEALYRRARRHGAVFVPFSKERPVIRQDPEGRVVIECRDEVSRLPMTLHPRLTVVEEAILPGPAARVASNGLGVDLGPDGFLPSDNVHRLGFKTNRREIFGLLPDPDPLGRRSREDSMAAVMLEIRALERTETQVRDRAAWIDPGLCARCLTCLRSCPHGAVRVGERVEIDPEACFSCGICEAACPAEAITLGMRDPDRHPLPDFRSGETVFRPGSLVAFGCRRSADRAQALCRHLGRSLPEDLVFVPVECAGRISIRMILGALEADAAGVLVLACHAGNCHAERGNLDARARVNEVRVKLREIGLDEDRVRYHTLAANTGVEFGRVVREFSEAVHKG